MSDAFYVYEHWRPDTNECFYVGKGKANRAYRVTPGSRKRNWRYQNIVAKVQRLGLDIDIRIITGLLSEADAFRQEAARIAYWRSIGVDLVNITTGGGGTAGLSPSAEARRKISEANRGRVPSPEERARISVGCRSSEAHKAHCRALAAAQKGVPRSAELRAKLSAAKKGKHKGPRKWTLSPEGHRNMSEAAKRRPVSLEKCAKMRSATKQGHWVRRVESTGGLLAWL